jgi:hypothetical protein
MLLILDSLASAGAIAGSPARHPFDSLLIPPFMRTNISDVKMTSNNVVPSCSAHQGAEGLDGAASGSTHTPTAVPEGAATAAESLQLLQLAITACTVLTLAVL